MSRSKQRPKFHAKKWFRTYWGHEQSSGRRRALESAFHEMELEATVDDYTPHIRPTGRARWFRVIRATDVRLAELGAHKMTELYPRKSVRRMTIAPRIARRQRARLNNWTRMAMLDVMHAGVSPSYVITVTGWTRHVMPVIARATDCGAPPP